MNRVVVTGAGCLTSLGNDVASFQKRLFAAEPGFRPVPDATRWGLGFRTVADVVDFNAAEWLTANQLRMTERCSQFAIAAARQALTSSRMLNAYEGDDIAVVLGCSTAGRSAEEPETAKLYTTGGRVHPLTVPRSMANAGTSHVCMEYGITGPAYTVSTACASSAHAIGQAFHMVRSGMVRAAVTGGHEAPLTYGFLKSWDSLHVVSPDGCKPFASDRDGMTLGEGAAIVALERMDTALERGANILAEIVGFGMSSDASHITQTNVGGPAAAMRRALKDARAQPADVGYVNAHGTGTEVNDRVEAEALGAVFGDAAASLPISSTKSLHGHAMGASGGIEFIATCLALHAGILPAARPPASPDEQLGLGGILRVNTPVGTTLALSNSFAFGGLNAVLALRSFIP